MFRTLALIAGLASLLAAADPTPPADAHAFVTTAMGRGADVMLKRDAPAGEAAASADMAVRYNKWPTHHQIAYLRFDLQNMQLNPRNQPRGRRPIAARLHLTLTTGVVHQADYVFNIWGLIDRKDYGQNRLGQDWDERAISWANAPGNNHRGGGGYDRGDPGTGGMDHQFARHLGTLTFTKGERPGTELTFSSPELLEMITGAPQSGLVTIMITRANGTEQENALSFAAKEHATFHPPMLSLLMGR